MIAPDVGVCESALDFMVIGRQDCDLGMHLTMASHQPSIESALNESMP
jgi:hypothetical protein